MADETLAARFERHHRAVDRFRRRLAEVERDVVAADYAFGSPRGAVNLRMGGDFRLRALTIDAKACRESGIGNDDLSDEVIAAYNGARQMVHMIQTRRLLGAGPAETEGDDS